MLYATAPVIHRKGVSAAGAMAAVTTNTAAIAAMVIITDNTNMVTTVIITVTTDNTNMVATVIIMSTTKATVVTKGANTVVTAVAEKGFAVCLIMVTCVL